MSGIVGVLGIRGEHPDSLFLQGLTQHMAFRGPDRQLSWVGDGIGLGHALLSTSPESTNEQQPLSLDGQVWIVADARLDARGELLSQLQSAGHECPMCAGDGELILRAYTAWGEACLNRFLGDFCFAIWDGRHRSLFCAHDQLGIKPFYYAETKRWLVFGNTLDSIRMHPEVSSRLNDLAIADFLLFGANQDPATTTFADIRRLPPAHALTWCAGKLSLRRYWTPPIDDEIHYKDAADYEEEFRQLLQTAVKDRLRADRAAVSFSGGLDSTSVAAFARYLGPSNLRAVTIVFDEVMPDSERYYSGLAGRSLGIPIDYLIGDCYLTAVQDGVLQVRRTQPEENVLPSFDTDFYKLANSTARILLTGEGGDVGLFPSNSHFRRLLKARHLGRFVCDGTTYAILQRGLPPMGMRTLLKRRFGLFDPWHHDYPGWLNRDFESRLRLREQWKTRQTRLPQVLHPHRPEALAALLAPYWQNFFEGCDPGVTGVCLEHVHPYFDLRVLRFLLAIPPVPWTLDKFLARSAMRDILPEDVRLRPKTPLADDPALIFVRNNRSAFTRVPLNIATYVNTIEYEAFLRSPAALSRNSYQFSLRPALFSAWLSSAAVFQGN